MPGVDARGEQNLGEAARAIVELRVGPRALAAAKRDDVGPVRPVPAHDVRDAKLLKNLH